MNPRAQASPASGQDPQATDRVRAEIAVLEVQFSQLRGPSIPQLSLGELQCMANTQLQYAWQCQLVRTLIIFRRSEAPQKGYSQSEVTTALADGK